MKKIYSVLLAAVLCCGLAGCGHASSADSGENMTMDDMPYGSTLVYDDTRSIAIQYDKRFVTAEIADAVCKFYESLQTKNTKEFVDCQLSLYHEYEMQDVYNNKYTDEDITESTYASLEEYFGGEFVFSMVDITDDVSKDNLSPKRDALKNMLIDLAEEQKIENMEQDIEEFHELTLTRYLTKADSGIRYETDNALRDENLYAVKYQGEWKIIYS